MAMNNAGGYTFTIDQWSRLERFLILGTDGPTYYASERDRTLENIQVLAQCVKDDGVRTVDTIVEIAKGNRATKITTLLFALAYCAKIKGAEYEDTRRAANQAVGAVCRIGTHILNYAAFLKSQGGWGAGTRRALARWYNEMDPEKLVYQLAKYQKRDGWAHRDILRVSHARPATPEHGHLFSWAVGKGIPQDAEGDHLQYLYAHEGAKRATRAAEVIELINDFGLTRESIPTEFLNDTGVWGALLQRMPVMATIRNLGKMSSIGMLNQLSSHANTVIERITNEDAIKHSRIHPVDVLKALIQYQKGRGLRGKLSWNPNGNIVDALDDALHKSFHTIEPTGKNFYLALDVSGSMSWEDIGGMPGINPREASAVMAMVTARTEQNYYTGAFTGQITPLSITPRMRLDQVIRTVSGMRFGNTDCALPMLDAIQKGLEVDTFVVYTDNQTWAGNVQPNQALEQYRQHSGRDAKLAVVGMTATEFSIADPKDPGMMDFVGFDSAAPRLLADFARGLL
jgi:60 kDa SS-A/Ro ribonucleoprotein